MIFVDRIDMRIIPACAGNTQGPTTTVSATRDHPRMRGEHWTQVRVCVVRLGSSPHARGTPIVVAWYCGLLGIIPACAGNTTDA